MLSNGITAIIPVYNTDYILFKNCIESVLNQSYKDIELIIINDGSKYDNSVSYKCFIEELNDKRIRYIESSNYGVSYSRNLGIELSTKEYITFIDSDDIIYKDFFVKAINFLCENELDGVLAGVRKQYSNSVEDLTITSKENYIFNKENMNLLINKVIAYETKETRDINNCFFSGCVSKIFKTEIVKKLKFNEKLKLGEDVVFNLDYLNICKRFGIIQDIGYVYILRNNSTVTSFREDMVSQSIILFNEIKKNVSDENINYFYYRVLKQFNWIMYGMIFHKNSNLNIYEKYIKIKELFKIDIFYESFNKINIGTLSAKTSYRLMYYLIRYRLFIMLTLIFSFNNYWRNKK